jgi:hypothetical protein
MIQSSEWVQNMGACTGCMGYNFESMGDFAFLACSASTIEFVVFR